MRRIQTVMLKHSIAVVLAISLPLVSCAYKLEPLDPEARTLYYYDVQSVLVVPFVDHTGTPGIARKVTELFTAELARFSEVGVIHSSTVFHYLENRGIEINDSNFVEVGMRMGKDFGVETVLLGAVTEYQPYFPPILGLSMELLAVTSGQSLLAVGETYDSSLNYTRKRLEYYAGSKKTSDSVYGIEYIMRKKDAYLQFAIYSMIRKHL